MTRVSFADVEWEQVRLGLRQKQADGMRLVEHSRDCVEEQWCMRAHTGYVISGQLFAEFRDRDDETYSAGDGLHIPSGDGYAHKGHVRTDEPVLMYLVD